MRKFLGLVLLAALVGCTKVEPGYVAVKVNNYGSQRGVADFPLHTGRVWYNPFTEDVHKFPTYQQNYLWTADERAESPVDESFTVNSIEGASLNFDVSFNASFIADSVPKVFVAFRKSAHDIIYQYVRNVLRGSFSSYASRMKVTEIFGERKQALQDSVEVAVARKLAPFGMHIEQLSIVGKMRVDDKVEASINAVLTAAQKAIEAENKIRQAEAEAHQMIERARGDSLSAVIKAAGQAEANSRIERSLTPELIEYNTVLKWDGKLPMMTGQGGIPLLDLRSR